MHENLRTTINLQPAYAGGTTPYSLSADDNIPTVEKFSFGHFFGITYNFGKPKPQEK